MSTTFTRDSLTLTRSVLGKSDLDAHSYLPFLSRLVANASTEAHAQFCLKISTLLSSRSRLFNPMESIARELTAHRPIQVLFINDNGTYAGAGIANYRQAQAFALNGHQVHLISLSADEPVGECMHSAREECAHKGLPIAFHHLSVGTVEDSTKTSGVARTISQSIQLGSTPTLAVIGNLHSICLSPDLIIDLLARKIPVVIYAHDLDWVTGGCTYPQYHQCNRFLTGCRDEHCLKPRGCYPPTADGYITWNYLIREAITRLPGVALFTNSDWSSSFFKERFSWAQPRTVHYGLDTDIFRPDASAREQLRARFQLADDTFVVAVGADNLARPGKGGALIERIISSLSNHRDIRFLSFGFSEISGENVLAYGFTRNPQDIASVFAASDVFLNPATIEAFGQTAIEAAACGCPTLTLRGTGLDDAVCHGVSGVLARDAQELEQTILSLKDNREALQSLSRLASDYIAKRFSLQQQYVRWIQALTVEAADIRFKQRDRQRSDLALQASQVLIRS